MELRALKAGRVSGAVFDGRRARDVLLASLLVCGLGCAGKTRAGEEPRIKFDAAPTLDLTQRLDARLDPDATATARPPQRLDALFDIGSLCVPATRTYSATDFSARKYFAPDQRFEPAFDRTQSLRTTTVWQRLNDYRSKDRVRLVTLWQDSGSSLSLQAGKHGEASLQWTSRSMNRGGSTRGLLDKLVAASLGAAGIAIMQSENSARSALSASPNAPAVMPIRPTVAIAAMVSHAP